MDEHTAQPQAFERPAPCVLADGIVNHIAALGTRDLFDTRDEILGAIIDDVSVAVGLGDGGLLRRSRRADRCRPQHFQPLSQQQPDPAGRRMHQHGIPRLDRITRSEQKLRRQSLEHDRRGHVECNGVGKLDEPLGAHGSLCTICSGRQSIGHAIAHLEIGDRIANLGDNSRGLGAGNQRCRRPGIQAAAEVGVDEVDADRALYDARLAGPGSGGVECRPFQRLRSTGGAHHHAHVRDLIRHISPHQSFNKAPYADNGVTQQLRIGGEAHSYEAARLLAECPSIEHRHTLGPIQRAHEIVA